MATTEKRGDTYRITVSCGYDLTGKQIRRHFTYKPEPNMTKKQIEKELNRQAVMFEEKVQTGQYIDSSVKFAEFTEQWLEDYAKEHLRAKTVAQYTALLPRINAAMGHMRIDRIQPQHIIDFYKQLEQDGMREDTKYKCKLDFKKYLAQRKLTKVELSKRAGICVAVLDSVTRGNNISYNSVKKICSVLGAKVADLFSPVGNGKLSGKTVHHYHTLLSSILSTAVQWQIIVSNPCERVKPPKAERKEANYLDENQAAELLTALEDEPIIYKALFTLILYTGMRRGEACGLEWEDIDLVNGIADINKASLYLTDKGIFDDDTKNATSRRVISVPAQAIDVLKQYKAYQAAQKLKLGDQWQKSKKIFTSADGKPIHPDTVSGWFRKFIQRHNLPQITVHGLRHTNATLMIANGTDIKTVSKRLGHADVSTTGNIYTHAIKSADERASQALTDIFAKSKQA